MSDASPKGKDKARATWIKALLQAVVCVVLLAAAGVTIWMIYATEPTAQREGATRKSAALVETVPAEFGTFTPTIRVLGHVEAADDIILSPRISGRITTVERAFAPGGLVSAAQPLVRLDEADFRIRVAQMRSELLQIKADLTIERGRQDVAKQEFALLGEEISEDNRALVLREPQVEAIKAQISAAEASLEQATLDLQRTTIDSPFPAKVVERYVNVGSQVSPSTPLARIVGTETYWINATVPLRHLHWLEFEETDEAGSTATLRMPQVWGDNVTRSGKLLRTIGNVDQETRLARVLIEVTDPLALKSDEPPLVLGTLLQVSLRARPVSEVVRISRSLLRTEDTVWVMNEDGKLDIRKPDIVFRDADYAYISSGISKDERVIVTNLATVTPGVSLRESGDTAAGVATAAAGDQP